VSNGYFHSIALLFARVATINWGFIAGKRKPICLGTHGIPYALEQPAAWFHDVLHADGTPYRQREVDLIRKLTSSVPHP